LDPPVGVGPVGMPFSHELNMKISTITLNTDLKDLGI
jgi:hypothetical protein